MINDIIQLLGMASPQLSLLWTGSPNTKIGYDQFFTLNCPGGPMGLGGDAFVAPVNGVLNLGIGMERIILPNGSTPKNAVILKVDPQVYLRLTRMYATQIEGRGANTNLSERPVPCYFVYTQTTPTAMTDGAVGGLYLAGQTLNISGDLTIHDQFGFPIDPIAVADAFRLFIQLFATMNKKALNSKAVPANPVPQLNNIVLLGGAAATTIHLISPNGTSNQNGGANFGNLTPLAAALGYYQIIAPANAINALATGNDVKIGAATNGTMGNSYTIRPATVAPAAAALTRDFLRAYVVDSLNTYLLGELANPLTVHDRAVTYGLGPVVCDNEQVTLLSNGNECLGAVNSITNPLQALTLVASQVIDSDFVLPPMAVPLINNERWPNFPVLNAGSFGSSSAIPANIKNNFVISAHFVTDPIANNADVVVSLNCPQFAPGDSVRIYNRLFNQTDGTESRGDGAGGIIDGLKNVYFLLKDPFGQVDGAGNYIKINNPKLMLDVVLVNRGMFKRTFGNIQCTLPLGDTALTAAENGGLVSPGTVLNNLNNATERGVSPSGISGTFMINPSGLNFSQMLPEIIGEGPVRHAPRYPTMARNDTMVASYTPGGSWQAFCGGTILSKEALSNFPLMGNPGSPGGKEYSSAGVYTQGGPLAYEIARAAYRRTRNVVERMGNLALTANANSWNPPAAPAAGGKNTWAAATLQTIAAHCETPEIGLNYDKAVMPDQLSTLVAQLQAATIGPLPGWIPTALSGRIQTAINNFGTDPQHQRGYDELIREFTSSIYGRKDTYWSLLNALGSARECIYIQGSFLSHTTYPGDIDEFNDMLVMLRKMIEVSSRLKVIICLGKPIHLGKGYESFEAREYKARLDAVEFLQGDKLPNSNVGIYANRVLAFHPTGFPMRPKMLHHQVVIVDDMWALVGSSTFRRRGMQFDGSQDVVLFDKNIVNGKSAGIKNFRIQLMREHLNLQGSQVLTPGLQVRLNDLHDAFYAIKELLDSGGAGLISPIWKGDRTDMAENLHPEVNLGDPNSASFEPAMALAVTLINLLSTTSRP